MVAILAHALRSSISRTARAASAWHNYPAGFLIVGISPGAGKCAKRHLFDDHRLAQAQMRLRDRLPSARDGAGAPGEPRQGQSPARGAPDRRRAAVPLDNERLNSALNHRAPRPTAA
jgi:hypothetical protein